jgi:hypothetical protein
VELLTRPPRLLSYFHYALIGALCLGCLYLIQLGLFVIAEQQHPWITGDWLINYGAGFVRRGMSGEIMLALAHITGREPAFVVAWCQLALYVVFFAAMLAALFRRTIGLPLLLICFSPATLLFPILDIAALGRKEIITFAFFACFVLLLRRPPTHVRTRIAVIAILSIVATLMHELFAFFTPYFVLAETFARPADSPRRLPLTSLTIVMASSLTLVVLVLFGSQIDGDAVCAKLIANGLSPESCNGAMYWQSRSFFSEIAHTFDVAGANDYGTVYSRGALLALLPVLVTWLTVDSMKRNLPRLVAGVALCLLWSLPLFLSAVDWGRFLSIHFVMLMMVAVSMLPHVSQDAGVARVSLSMASRIRAIAVYVIVFYVTLLTQAFWSIPHCCRTSLGDGVVGLFLEP